MTIEMTVQDAESPRVIPSLGAPDVTEKMTVCPVCGTPIVYVSAQKAEAAEISARGHHGS